MKKIYSYIIKPLDDGRVELLNARDNVLQTDNLKEIFYFILEGDGDGHRTVWDLDQSVAPILKLLGQEKCRELASPEHKTKWQDFNIFYIPKKLFAVKYHQYEFTLYGVDQYYPDHKDAEDPYDVAAGTEILLKAVERMGLPEPSKLTSPVAIYEETAMRRMMLPTLADMPKDALEASEYAYHCAGKAWVTAYKLGHFKKVYDYDIVSSYPSEASRLFSTTYCNYKKSATYQPCDVAFMHGTITIDAPISPIIRRTEEGNLINPVGAWDDYITSEEADFIKRWGLGNFKMKDGWFLKFYAGIKPLEMPMQRLFNTRRRMSKYDDLIDRMCKRIAVGIVGKFAEQYADNKPGKYFNPIWHALVTSRTRLKVAEFIFGNKLLDNLLHVSTDGVLIDSELDIDDGYSMGDWRLSKIEDALIVSSGQLFFADKHPKGINYDMLLEMLEAEPDKSYYGVAKQRMQTLEESLEGNNFEDMGKVKDYWTAVDFTPGMTRHDRKFNKLPVTGGDLLNNVYTSKPLKV
jgi:hypothetical protein